MKTCPRCNKEINPNNVLTYLDDGQVICKECWQEINECQEKQEYRDALCAYEAAISSHDWSQQLSENQLAVIERYDNASRMLLRWGFDFMRSRRCKMNGIVYKSCRQALSDCIVGKTEFTKQTEQLIFNLF